MTQQPETIKKLKSVKDVILFSPHDNKLNRGIGEIEFYNDFHCKLSEYDELVEYLNKVIVPTKNEFKEFVVLSGYSGCGKTTFINWFAKQAREKNHEFLMINSIKQPVGQHSDQELIKSTIILELAEMMIDSLSLQLIFRNMSKFANVLFDKDVDDSLKESFSKIYQEIVKETATYDEKEWAVNKFLNSMSFKVVLFLYYLENILRFKQRPEKESYIFCFDNLDELHYEYLTSKIWEDFLDVRDRVQTVCENPKLKIDFDFLKRVVTILILRESNISISIAQKDERIKRSLTARRMIRNGTVQEIIDKRFKYIERNKVEFDLINNPLWEFLQIFQEEKEYVNKVILPLVNYDYRKIFHIMLDLTTQQDSYQIVTQFNAEQYKILKSNYPNLARGIFFNIFSAYAMKHFHVLAPTPKNGCRPSRVILTAIFNSSYPNNVPKDIKARTEYTPQRTNLFKLVETLGGIYSAETITECLEKFFVTSDASWSHLITIYGIHLNAQSKLEWKPIETALRKHIQGVVMNEDEYHILLTTELNFNAAGYIYLRYFITHFEYLSYDVCKRPTDPTKITLKYKPLCQMLKPVMVSGRVKFEFEVLIDYVLTKLIEYKSNVDRDFRDRFKSFTPEKFTNKDNALAFSSDDTKQNKNFYITRVVTTHLRYIEQLRSFVWHDERFNKLIEQQGKLDKSITREEIQKRIVALMDKYIQLLYVGIKDPSVNVISENLRKDLINIQNIGFKTDRYYPLETRMDE